MGYFNGCNSCYDVTYYRARGANSYYNGCYSYPYYGGYGRGYGYGCGCGCGCNGGC